MDSTSGSDPIKYCPSYNKKVHGNWESDFIFKWPEQYLISEAAERCSIVYTYQDGES